MNYSKCTKNEIILSNFNLDQINFKLFSSILNRRLANEPISKIINKKSFWKDDFYVNKFVLDPRPETEAIIEESLNIIKNKQAKLKILDIVTGSGAIAISLAREFVNANIIAIDISNQAIQVANKNITEKNLNNQMIKNNLYLITTRNSSNTPIYITRCGCCITIAIQSRKNSDRSLKKCPG